MNAISWIKNNITVSSILPVRSQGTDNCPFCNKRNKWFTNQDKGGKCFSPSCFSNQSTNKLKDVIDIYSLYHNCSKGDSIKYLSKGYVVGFKPNNEYFDFNQRLATFYHNQLLTNNEAKQYLLNRGITEYLIRAFSLGFAPTDIKQYLNKGFTKEELEKFGLLKGNNYIYFRDRIIFPVIDINNNIVHFQGRYIYEIPLEDNGEEAFPKYLSTKGYKDYPTIPYYLFQENRLKTYDSKKPLYITEGIPDCLSLVKVGLQSVGLFGLTGLTNHAHKLDKFETICICGDNDTFTDVNTGKREYKSWKVLLPQIKELQLLLPNTAIRLFRPPYVIANKPVKDINDFVETKHFNNAQIREYIEANSTNYLERYIANNINNRDKHLELLTLCKTTNRGLDTVAKYLEDNKLINLEYILSLI